LTVRAGIVFVLLATAATFTLTYVMLPVVTGVDFGAFAPGLVGGFAGFALYTWRTYGPLWRKVGRRRIAI
jgi:hypothetical protein